MKHHFADFLEREGNYFTIIPNIERYSYIADFEIENKEEVKVLTINKKQKREHWEQVFNCSNLEELTLNEPSHEQVEVIRKLNNIKRLRVSYYRAKNIEFISSLINLEELVLEYVSGFSDLSPLRNLEKLKSIHIENLRKVKDFQSLSGIKSLRYLYINGTFDWKQPIDNFDFLKGLPNLEILKLMWVINKMEYPALAPIITLKKLKKIVIINRMFSTEEYAFLETALNNVQGAIFEPYKKVVAGYCDVSYLPKKDYRSKLSDKILKEKHPEVRINHEGRKIIKDTNPGWFEFLGKGAGRVKCSNPLAEEKCLEFKTKYELMKEQAKVDIKEYIKTVANNV